MKRRRSRSRCRRWCPRVARRPTRLRSYHPSPWNISRAFPRSDLSSFLLRRVSKLLAGTLGEARTNDSPSADSCRVPEFECCSICVQSFECPLGRFAARKPMHQGQFARAPTKAERCALRHVLHITPRSGSAPVSNYGERLCGRRRGYSLDPVRRCGWRLCENSSGQFARNPSRFRQSENQKCWRPLSEEGNSMFPDCRSIATRFWYGTTSIRAPRIEALATR